MPRLPAESFRKHHGGASVMLRGPSLLSIDKILKDGRAKQRH